MIADDIRREAQAGDMRFSISMESDAFPLKGGSGRRAIFRRKSWTIMACGKSMVHTDLPLSVRV